METRSEAAVNIFIGLHSITTKGCWYIIADNFQVSLYGNRELLPSPYFHGHPFYHQDQPDYFAAAYGYPPQTWAPTEYAPTRGSWITFFDHSGGRWIRTWQPHY